MNKFKLSIEALRRDARFTVGLTAEQADHLARQMEPVDRLLEAYRARLLEIRKDGRLSDSGKAADVGKARSAVLEAISQHSQSVSKTALLQDLRQRIATKTNGARERAQKAMPPDAGALAQELRQSILPRMLKDAEDRKIPGEQVVAKLIMRAAEGYASDPGKAELIISSLAIGWPWAPTLPEGTMQAGGAVIASQIAAEEQQALVQTQSIQQLFDRVVETAVQTVKELG